jgi:hypothetical protein
VNALPERPNLDHLRKQAKDLLRQYRARDPAAFRQYLPAARDKSDAELSAMLLQLRDAQSCIARQHEFSSWQELKQHVLSKMSPAPTSNTTQAEVAQWRYRVAQLAVEQARPRTAVPFAPEKFDEYVGYYQLDNAPTTLTTFTHIFRDGARFFEQLNIEKRGGVLPVELFPESDTKFFAIRVAAQISFLSDAQGRVIRLVFRPNGLERAATRVDESVVYDYEAGLAKRIKHNTASPGAEEFLRRYIVGCEKWQPNFEDMSAALVKAVQRLRPVIEKRHERVGAFKTLVFKGVDRSGKDVYEATFTQGQVEYRIPPLNADGKAESIAPREIP